MQDRNEAKPGAVDRWLQPACNGAMKWWSVPVALLSLLACTDPTSYQPFDPTKPDPPAPPVLTSPANGWMSDDYAYPQNVSCSWQAVPSSTRRRSMTNRSSPALDRPGASTRRRQFTPPRRTECATGGFGQQATAGTTTPIGPCRPASCYRTRASSPGQRPDGPEVQTNSSRFPTQEHIALGGRCGGREPEALCRMPGRALAPGGDDSSAGW